MGKENEGIVKGSKEDYSFQVDLKGIIRLLSENLYSSGDVFLRELLQNAVDAIEARRVEEPGFADGRIRIRYQQMGNRQARLVFSDNGIGLTREEIHTFLSVIGQSSKRGEMRRGSFIGQFGIGLLSCFLVADEIVVRSRSVHEIQTYRWLGRSDGTYQVTVEPKKEERHETGEGERGRAKCYEGEGGESGTEVTLVLKERMACQYREEKVISLLREYGFLIQIPVEFEGAGGVRRVNDGFIPWRQSFCSNEEILRFGEQMFGEEFFGVVPISGEGLKGYAFISQRQTSAAAEGRHKIFLKDMLITEEGKELIPKWAFFTRCILNAENLTPMASREGFVSDHQLTRARNEIEKCIFDYFVALSQYDVNKLKQLTSIHNVAVKSLAVENEQIYKLLFPFLTFFTNKGRLTGFQVVEAAKRRPVYYCTELDDYRRACPLVGNGVLINAGYIYDTRLLQFLKRYQRGIQVEMFDEASYGALLEEPTPSVRKEMEALMARAGRVLGAFQCGAVLKQFEPAEVPALYVPGGEGFLTNALGERSFSGFLEGFDLGETGMMGDFECKCGTRLYLNGKNSLIRRLAAVKDEELTASMVQVLYVHAMLTGHYTLKEKETEVLNAGLIRLMEFGLGGNG
ncbi:MAG: HSP90 family protein [Lachnospiraceae bacterium]|jgi:molecular chaperone HtpG|nr:HSP90 family protein [Lachnospiraceae bacterium]